MKELTRIETVFALLLLALFSAGCDMDVDDSGNKKTGGGPDSGSAGNKTVRMLETGEQGTFLMGNASNRPIQQSE